MDKIYINNLEIYANIGDDNFDIKHKFIVELEIDLILHNTGSNHSANNSIDIDKLISYTKEKMSNITYARIETAAEMLCNAILLDFPMTYKVKLCIERPIESLKNLSSFSVEIIRQWHDTYVYAQFNNSVNALSIILDNIANYEDCEVYMISEAHSLSTSCDKSSQIYKIITLRTPQEFSLIIDEINLELYKNKINMELELIYYDDIILYENNIIIPAPNAHTDISINRCMNDINPYYIHPILKTSIIQLLT